MCKDFEVGEYESFIFFQFEAYVCIVNLDQDRKFGKWYYIYNVHKYIYRT